MAARGEKSVVSLCMTDIVSVNASSGSWLTRIDKGPEEGGERLNHLLE